MKRRGCLILALLAIACPLPPVWGQAVQTQIGRALDANPSVGGPANAAPNPPPLANTQYLIVGEGRGGRSFQGFVPYSATNQFQGTLGSSALYNFSRDSVGIPTIQQGPSAIYQPQPYFTSSKTVFSAGQVPPTLITPTNTAGPGPTLLNPFAQSQYAAPPPPQQAVSLAGNDLGRPLFSPVEYPNLSPTEQLDYRRQILAEQPSWGWASKAEAPLAIGQLPAGKPPTPPGSRAQSLNPAIKPIDTNVPDALPLGADSRIMPLSGRPEEPAPPGELAEPGAQPGQPAAAKELNAGQDLYFDLLKKAQIEILRGQRAPGGGKKPAPGIEGPGESMPPAGAERGLNGPPTTPAPGETGQPPAPGRATPGRTGKEAGGPEGGLKPAVERNKPVIEPAIAAPRVEQAVVSPAEAAQRAREGKGELGAGKPHLLTPAPMLNLGANYESFASDLPSRANTAIRQAEQAIGQRKFYEAVDQLAQAQRWDPQNPLVWLRAGHAYLAAGEYYSAAMDLRRALRIFPSAVSIRTDLAKLFGPDGKALLDDRLAGLQQLAQKTDDLSLWMLLGYVQYANGRSAAAGRTAEYLLAHSGKDPEAAAVARFVLENVPSATAPDGGR